MKTIFLIIITASIILVGGFAFWSYIQYTHYETWGNNEHWYYHPDGYDVECNIRLYQSPSPCEAIDENGIVVDRKIGLGNWNGVIWVGDPNYCKEQGGIWNDTVSGCYGLYDMCENDGGIPRFLKNSQPFPDIEENKPIPYLMDCYGGFIIDDYFMNEIIDIDDNLGCPNFCSQKVESDVFSFCGGDGFFAEGYIFTNNSTHYFDHNICEWGIHPVVYIELDELHYSEFGNEGKRIPLELQRVLDSCNSTGIQPSIGYRYSNDTHKIANNSCEWEKIDE